VPFTHDTDVALQYAAALINTRPTADRPEGLGTVEDLLTQMDGWGWTGAAPRSADDLAAVRRVRERLRDYWDADVDEAVLITNDLLRDGDARPRLVNHEPIGWHIHATDPDAPVAVRMAVDTALAMVDVIRAGELDRLRTCEADDCDDVFVDLSRNRSRKFCDGTCGNKANVAAYRARRAGSAPESRAPS
jgi:predicted RNA-binding Zn ribbon-like protein